MRCQACGAYASPSVSHCAACGEPFGPSARVDPHRPALAERRRATALFADIVGSMDLIETLDAEEAQQLFDPLIDGLIQAVERFGGYVVHTAGDGVFALFGAPTALEAHAAAGVAAALAMRDAVRASADALAASGRPRAQVRIGLNTGRMFVRSVRIGPDRWEYTAIGHATSLAARMEQMAPPGGVLVSQHTHALCADEFEFRSRGAVEVKGVQGTIEVFDVLGTAGSRRSPGRRLQPGRRDSPTRYVGREAELARLLAVASGESAAPAVVIGEAGVGKSRLCDEVVRRGAEGIRPVAVAARPHDRLALAPVQELVRALLGQAPDTALDAATLREAVAELDPALTTHVPHLQPLLGVAGTPAEAAALAAMAPPIRTARTFDAVHGIIAATARRKPLLLLLEDLHWIDSSTQAWLEQAATGLADADVRLLATARPEYRSAVPQGWQVVELGPLSGGDGDDLLAQLMGDAPAGLQHAVAARSGGNPFFIEELARAWSERPHGSARRSAATADPVTPPVREDVGGWDLPASVEAVLASRIDRLPPSERRLLQALALLGERFSVRTAEHLAHRLPQPEPATPLARRLDGLAHSGFLRRPDSSGTDVYLFEHALTREVAYETLPRAERRPLHGVAATAIETVHADEPEPHLLELARHHAESGSAEAAARYLLRAAVRETAQMAYEQAIAHLKRGLDLQASLPPSQAAAALEADLRLALIEPFSIAQGYSSVEAQAAAARAAELAAALVRPDQRSQALTALARIDMMAGRFARTVDQLDEVAAICRAREDEGGRLHAEALKTIPLFYQAQYRAALDVGEATREAYARATPADRARIGADHLFAGLSHLGKAAACSGQYHRALELADWMLQQAEQLDHALAVTYARAYASEIHYLLNQPDETERLAAAALRTAEDHGFAHVAVVAAAHVLWARSARDRSALTALEGLVAAYRASGVVLGVPWLLALLAEACLACDDDSRLAAALGQAEEFAAKTEERVSVVALATTAASRLARQGRPEAAEASFRHALDLAADQRAHGRALRIGCGLAELWRESGRGAEVPALLAPLLAATDGADVPDVRRTRRLLAGGP